MYTISATSLLGTRPFRSLLYGPTLFRMLKSRHLRSRRSCCRDEVLVYRSARLFARASRRCRGLPRPARRRRLTYPADDTAVGTSTPHPIDKHGSTRWRKCIDPLSADRTGLSKENLEAREIPATPPRSQSKAPKSARPPARRIPGGMTMLQSSDMSPAYKPSL